MYLRYPPHWTISVLSFRISFYWCFIINLSGYHLLRVCLYFYWILLYCSIVIFNQKITLWHFVILIKDINLLKLCYYSFRISFYITFIIIIFNISFYWFYKVNYYSFRKSVYWSFVIILSGYNFICVLSLFLSLFLHDIPSCKYFVIDY